MLYRELGLPEQLPEFLKSGAARRVEQHVVVVARTAEVVAHAHSQIASVGYSVRVTYHEFQCFAFFC